MSETETWEFTRRERAYLIDAVMVLMHHMKRIPENDKSELPDLQRLLERLMDDRSSSSPDARPTPPFNPDMDLIGYIERGQKGA